MYNHLAITIDGRYQAIKPDTSVDLEDSNPIFNDGIESYSYAFELPLDGNRETFGNVDDVQSDHKLVEQENKPMSIIVDGVPMRNGKVATSEDQEIIDSVSISMTSNVRSLSDYFADLECQDIPIPEEDKPSLQIGEMIGNVHAEYSCDITLEVHIKGSNNDISRKLTAKDSGSVTIELPALGFSQPAICNADGDADVHKSPTVVKSFINVTDEYGGTSRDDKSGGKVSPAKFCNARVCYMHYKLADDGTSSDIVDVSVGGENGKFNPYLVLEADRPASGICFYVLYFLDCLFKFLKDYGISYDNSNLLKVADMKRLAFFTTHCKYDLEPKNGASSLYDFNSVSSINNWLKKRNCGGQLSIEHEKKKEIDGFYLEENGQRNYYQVGGKFHGDTIKNADFKVTNESSVVKARIMKMIANSQNFPNESVQNIIDSLWASFGIRFYLNQETMEVKPFFIKDVLCDDSEPIEFHGTVIAAHKENEKITGFRMQYSAQSDARERKANIINNVRDYDTSYDYEDYRNLTTKWTWFDIITQPSYGVSDMSLYVDKRTGNKYRIKVDGDAENVDQYHPLPFEVGQFRGVEIGDCSPEMEDFVEEVSSGFSPVIFNDVNGRNEKNVGSDTSSKSFFDADGMQSFTVSSVNAGNREQVLAAFIGEDMWHEYCERKIQTAFGTAYSNFYLRETCKTKEAFDPSSSDDGNSPLQTYDWGTSIAVMRGGGTDARIQYYDYNYDGFGSYKWRMTPGVYGMGSDSIDNWGAEYDYNGTPADGSDNGIGDEKGRFSLKIRSYIEAPYDIPSEKVHKGDILCDKRFARRGLYDTFMAEYAHFLLTRKVVKLEVMCEVAELLDIQWAKRYNIGGYIGWINKINTHITGENGIESVIIEMYVL